MDAGRLQVDLIRRSPALLEMYRGFYRLMLDAEAANLTGAGARVELGSGGGFFSELDPEIVTSDIRPIPGVDRVVDAQELPFPGGSLRTLFGMHVLHHLPDVGRFLGEATRCLAPGGGVVAIEPYWSPLARVAYTHAHPEPFDQERGSWEFESRDAMDSNQALPYIMLVRDRDRFDREWPELEVVPGPVFSGLSYLLTGGIWRRSGLPESVLLGMLRYERRTMWWKRWFGLHFLFTLRRR